MSEPDDEDELDLTRAKQALQAVIRDDLPRWKEKNDAVVKPEPESHDESAEFARLQAEAAAWAAAQDDAAGPAEIEDEEQVVEEPTVANRFGSSASAFLTRMIERPADVAESQDFYVEPVVGHLSHRYTLPPSIAPPPPAIDPEALRTLQEMQALKASIARLKAEVDPFAPAPTLPETAFDPVLDMSTPVVAPRPRSTAPRVSRQPSFYAAASIIDGAAAPSTIGPSVSEVAWATDEAATPAPRRRTRSMSTDELAARHRRRLAELQSTAKKYETPVQVTSPAARRQRTSSAPSRHQSLTVPRDHRRSRSSTLSSSSPVTPPLPTPVTPATAPSPSIPLPPGMPVGRPSKSTKATWLEY